MALRIRSIVLAAIILCACGDLRADAKLTVGILRQREISIAVEPSFHARFGLAYPLTYKIAIPEGSHQLQASTRHDTSASWSALPEKISGDFFNGIEAVRFDYPAACAFVSASFNQNSDVLNIRISDDAGQPVQISFVEICRYYDDRRAAVVVSIDDWKAYSIDHFSLAIALLRSFHLPITAGIITGDCDPATWSIIQSQLDIGDIEAAAHTRTHPRWPDYGDLDSEIGGSKQDMIDNLVLPPLYRKNSTEFVYTWIAPFGETNDSMEAAVTRAGYLVDRLVGFSDGDFSTWNSGAMRYSSGGTGMEMGPPWGSTSITELNDAFDAMLSNGKIYSLLIHPVTITVDGEWDKPYVREHLSYISNRPDVWYVTFGHLFLYHMLPDLATGSIEVIDTPPAIFAQPADQFIPIGNPAVFSVSASGSAPLRYAWEKDGMVLDGATGIVYMLPSAQAGDDGAAFRCIVSNPAGSDTSRSAVLHILGPQAPVITSGPNDATVQEGEVASFSVSANGSMPMTYRWYANGAEIPGSTESHYALPAVSKADSGVVIHCIVSNALGADTSASAVLKVMARRPPSVTLHPVNTTVRVGEVALFRIAASGAKPLGYQWQKNYIPIGGAVDSVYVTPAVTQADSGSGFRCIVSNSTGHDTSLAAVLSVVALPSGSSGIVSDDFSSPTLNSALWTFINPRGDVTLSLVGAGTHDARLSLAIPAGSAHDAWTGENTGPRVMQNIPDVDFEVTAKYDANPAARYQIQGVLVQQDPANFIRMDFVRESETTQFYAASFTDGVPTVRADIAVQAGAPFFLRLKRTGDEWTGSYSGDGISWVEATTFSHHLTVGSIGPWAGNAGTPAPAFTALIDYFFNATSPIVPEDGGCLIVPPTITMPPEHRTVIVGNTAAFQVEAAGTQPFGYQWQKNGGDISGATGAIYTTPPVTPGDSGASFRCIVSNAAGRATSTTATLSVLGLPQVPVTFHRLVVLGSSTAEGEAARPLDSSWVNKYTRYLKALAPSSEVVNLATGGLRTFNVMPTGYIPPDPWNVPAYLPDPQRNITQALSLKPDLIIVNLPTNDCDEYIPVARQIANYDTVLMRASAEGVPVYFTTSQPRNIDQAGRTLLLQLRDITLAHYPGQAIDFWTGLAEPDGTIRPEYNFDGTHLNTPGHAVLFDRVVSAVRIPDPRTPPDITIGPLSVSVFEGLSARFSVHVSGSAPLGSQWQRNGIDIPGAADTSYTTPPATLADSGSVFRCIVSNAVGRDTSSAVLLHVLQVHAPVVVLQPAAATVLEGHTGHFTVHASGTAPLTYRWQKNGVDISGAADTSYTTPPAPLAENGSAFRCIVSNCAGADTSSTALLTVTREPMIVSDDFHLAALDTALWKFINPRGDGSLEVVGTGTPDARLSLSIPSGNSHGAGTGGVSAPRVMQRAVDADFNIDAKFDSPLSVEGQMQGVLIQQDSTDFVTFACVRDSIQTRFLCASTVRDTAVTRIDIPLSAGNPLLLRVTRVGNQWNGSYSTNGTTWVCAVTFAHAMVVSSAGLFAGNAGSPAPPFVALFDYFFNAESPVVPEDSSATDATITANIKVFLEGPYAGGSMATSLRSAGVIPLRQPYGGAPWNYAGADSVVVVPEGVVDWVLVELRTDSGHTSRVETRAAFIRNDGKVVDLDGATPPSFHGVPPGAYYIVVRHRNHLAVMSAGAQSLGTASTLYDFTTGLNRFFGGEAKDLGGVFGMRGGDATGDGRVKYSGMGNDRLPILARIGGTDITARASGYFAEDANMDGQVKYSGSGNDRLVILNTIGGTDITAAQSTRVPE